MKLTVKDYQIVKQAVLEFKPGLTALIGPSNNGKSSIVKAIKAAVYTESGTTPIRHGSDSYIVGIQNNNHTVVYQKKEGSTKYLVDGKSFSRFGVNTPEEVSNALNMKEIVLNGNKIQLNFWDQMDKPFLLDKSSGELFKFIVDSGENDQLSQVLKSMVSDRQQLNKEADVIQGSIKSTENIINERNNYLESHKHVVDLADELITKKIKYDEYKDIKSIIDKMNKNDNEQKLYSSKLNEVLEETNRLEKIICVEDILKELNTIDNIIDKIKDNKNQQNILIDKINNSNNTLDNIKITEFIELSSLVNEYKNIKINIENVSNKNLMIEKSIPNKELIEKLQNILDLSRITSSLYQVNAKLDATKTKSVCIDSSYSELDDIQKVFKVCPLCGHKMGG